MLALVLFALATGCVLGWTVGMLQYRQELDELLRRQDAHEAEMQRRQAAWAADSSGMSREEWEGVLRELQQRTHEMARRGEREC